MPPPVEVALRIVADDQAQAVVARTERSIGQLGASNARLGVSGQAAAAGISKASNAITNLAGDAVGANNKVANLVEGLLSAAVGGPVVTAVAAGIAVVTAALFYFDKQAREAREGWEDYLKSLQKQSPLAVAGAQIDALREKLAAPEFAGGLYGRIFRAFGFGKSRTENILELAGVEQAYAQMFESISDAAAKNGAKVATRTADAAEKALRDRIANDPTLRGYSLAKIAQPARDDLKLRAFDTGDMLDPAEWVQFGDVAVDSLSRVNRALDDIGINLDTMKEGFLRSFEASIAGADNFADATIGAVGKAIKGTARMLGQEQFAKGAAKIAEGIFPPNPAAILSGLKHIAAGSLFMALAGGGGGGGYGAGGGGGASRQQEDVARATNRPRTIVFPMHGFIRSDDPNFQDFLREAYAGGEARA